MQASSYSWLVVLPYYITCAFVPDTRGIILLYLVREAHSQQHTYCKARKNQEDVGHLPMLCKETFHQ